MMTYEDFLTLLMACSGRVRSTYQEVVEDWYPEEPPITTLFAALGKQIVEDFDISETDLNRRIFSLIEQAMESSDQRLVTAVATGLIEAMVNRAARRDGLLERLKASLGPQSLNHANAWLAPC